jgi:uncharacterized protein (DUF433 family)
MNAVATTYEHVVLDEAGIPWIAGSNTKVVEIVLETLARGPSPEELHFQLPHLSLGQIHSALAYYWDHKAEADADIERRHQQFERWRREIGTQPLRAHLEQRRSS